MQITHATQHQKPNHLIENWAQDMNRYFFQRHTDGKQPCEKMLNIPHHQGNANQTYNGLPPYTCQNGYYQKTANKYW